MTARKTKRKDYSWLFSDSSSDCGVAVGGEVDGNAEEEEDVPQGKKETFVHPKTIY